MHSAPVFLDASSVLGCTLESFRHLCTHSWCLQTHKYINTTQYNHLEYVIYLIEEYTERERERKRKREWEREGEREKEREREREREREWERESGREREKDF